MTSDDESMEPTIPDEPAIEPALAEAFGARPTGGGEEKHDTTALEQAFSGDERYTIQGLLGRGGMGAVFRVHDARLGRDVALKILARFETAEHRRRFHEEARIAAQLQHPGIVPVYDYGERAGRLYITMKLVAGRTLAELLRSGDQADARQRVGIIEQVAQAVGYAHDRGVIHRDLKPSNVMVGAFGEVQVMDWGLAKVVGGGDADSQAGTVDPGTDRLASLAGRVMGTPSYMSPEQARGDVTAIDARSDVFALGGMLCEILTGEPVYRGTTSEEVRQQAARAATDRALELLDACDGEPELVALTRSCLAKDAADRPADATVLAALLEEHRGSLEQRAVDAHVAAAEAQERARHARRQRRLTLVLAVTVSLAVTAAVVGFHFLDSAASKRASRTAEAVREARGRADALLATARSADPARALGAWLEAREAVLRTVAVARAGESDDVTRENAETFASRSGAEADRAIASLRETARDAEMVRRLDDLRLERKRPFDPAEVDASYERAFRDYGLAVNAEDAAERIARSRIGPRLAEALDEWVVRGHHYRDRESAAFLKIRRIVEAADPHPLRTEVRAALYDGDGEAVKRLGRTPDLSEVPTSLIQLLASALQVFESNKACTDLLSRAWHERPGDFFLCYDLAHRLTQAQPPRLGAAYTYYTAALALSDRQSVRTERLMTMVRMGLRAEAEKEARRLQARWPDEPATYLALGLIAQARSDRDTAEKHFRKAVSMGTDNSGSCVSLANLLYVKRRYEEAGKWYRIAEERHAQRYLTRYSLGNVAKQLGDHEQAVRHYREAIAARRDHQNSWHNMGTSLMELGRVTQAINAMRRSVELGPDDAMSLHNLALFLDQAGRFAEALGFVDRAIASDEKRRRGTERYRATRARIAGARDVAARMVEVLAGKADLPGGAWPAWMSHCRERKHFALEARLWMFVEKKHPERLDDVAGQDSLRALECAARAAGGEGFDAARTSADGRGEMRAFVKRRLEALVAAPGSEARRGAIRSVLRAPAFRLLREPGEGALPAQEQAAWKGLWDRLRAAGE